MDTLKEKTMLEDLWNGNRAPWKIWETGDNKADIEKVSIASGSGSR